MKISIVIPAFNEAKLIADSLRSVQNACGAFHDLGWRTELIVCDNNSTDQTAALAEAEGAKVVFEPINQIARARNTGARAATGDWLVFVDADSFPSRELFEDVAAAIRSGRAVAGGSTVRLDQRFRRADWAVGGWNLLSRTLRWVAGSFIFCEASAFREIGGFNQDLFVAEELDLSQRLKRVARRRRQKLVILHRHPLTTSARKMRLYSSWEHMTFLLRAALRPNQTLKSRAACAPWYDGRR